MKQLILGVLAIAVFAIGCSQKPLGEGKYRITGTVVGMENGEIYISNYPEMDTIKVSKGKFQLEKEIEGVAARIAFVKNPSVRAMTKEGTLSLYIEPTVMTLELHFEDFSKSKLSGSKSQDDQYRLDEINEEIAADYQAELAEFEAVRKKFEKARKAGAGADELEAIKYEDNACREKLATMWQKQSEASLEFIKANPKSYASVNAFLFQLRDLKYAEAKAIYDQFNPGHLKSGMGAMLAKEIEDMNKGIPGALAGNFDTTDLHGKPIKLADFKGKYLLIDFWASWCVPCRKGNPHLIELFHKYHDKGLEILGVASDDRTPDAWRKAVEKDQIGIWHHILTGMKLDPETQRPTGNDIGDKYNISTLPTKILVGPDGIILGRFGSGGGNDEDMDRMLAEIFENK